MKRPVLSVFLASLFAPLACALPPGVIDRTYPGSGPDFEGWRPLTRRYLAVLAGRVLSRYQASLDYPSAEVPADVPERDLGDVVRTLAAGVMSAPGGRFRPAGKVNRLSLSLVLDRLGRSCRGWPDTVPRRRFHWPRDLRLPRDQQEAMERIFRFRILRADDLFFSSRKRFRPRRVATRYEALVALDRVLTVIGSRPERGPVDYPDVPDAHYARLAIRDLYRRGILGFPLPGNGVTRVNPPAHRIRPVSRAAPTLPLARAPYRPRTELDLVTSELPGARRLDTLLGELDELEVQRVRLVGQWDQLRVRGEDSGQPRKDLLEEVTLQRREVGRLHLSLARLQEDLPSGPKGSLRSRSRSTLRPAVQGGMTSAKSLYRRFTELRDQVRGVAAVPLPNHILPLLPLAARGTPLAGLLDGGEVAGEEGRIDTALLLTPEATPEAPAPVVLPPPPPPPPLGDEPPGGPPSTLDEDLDDLDDLDDLGGEDEDFGGVEEGDDGLDDLDDLEDLDF